MYMFPEMIELGLEEGKSWPTEVYRVVAQNLLLCNPSINARDLLIDGVNKVLSIPDDRIEGITIQELEEFGFVVGIIGS